MRTKSAIPIFIASVFVYSYFLFIFWNYERDQICTPNYKIQTVTVTAKPSIKSNSLLNDMRKAPEEEIIKKEENIIKFSERNTEIKCMNLPDFSGICEYKNLCYGGKDSLLFLNQNIEEGKIEELKIKEEYFEDRYRLPVDFPPPISTIIPYGDMGLYAYLHQINPKTLDGKGIQIIKEPAWFLRAHSTWNNPYYLMKDTSQLFDAKWYNKSAKLNLPSMENIFLLQNSIPKGWGEDLFPFLMEKHSNLYIRDINVEENFKNIDLTHPICFERQVNKIMFNLIKN